MSQPIRESATPAASAATWVVVPAYCEATVIAGVVSELRRRGWRVVVVDDGSSDRTAQVAATAGAVVVRHPINLGQGAALRTGFRYALAQPDIRFVVTFDADGQHDPDAIATMIAPLELGEADVVLGSRFLNPGVQRHIPLQRRTLLRIATWVGRTTTGLPLTDAHNGLRAFTTSGLRQLQLTQDRMAHASEIQAEIARHKLRCVERQVHVQYTTYSIAKGQRLVDAISILWDLLLTPRRPS